MRFYSFILFYFLLTTSSFAEVGVLAGARAGMNIAHLRKFETPAGFKKNVNLGSDIAAMLRIDFNKFIGFQAEIEFSQKGQAWKASVDSAKYYNKQVLNYIQIPLLAVARFGNDKVKAVIQLGPYLAYWAGGYTQTSTQVDKTSRESTNTKYLFTKNDNRLDVGITSGLGVNVKVGKGWIEVLARHNAGFLSTAKKNSGLPNAYNCNFSLSLGYLYTIK